MADIDKIYKNHKKVPRIDRIYVAMSKARSKISPSAISNLRISLVGSDTHHDLVDNPHSIFDDRLFIDLTRQRITKVATLVALGDPSRILTIFFFCGEQIVAKHQLTTSVKVKSRMGKNKACTSDNQSKLHVF